MPDTNPLLRDDPRTDGDSVDEQFQDQRDDESVTSDIDLLSGAWILGQHPESDAWFGDDGDQLGN